jgi:segregation and condensation protein A
LSESLKGINSPTNPKTPEPKQEAEQKLVEEQTRLDASPPIDSTADENKGLGPEQSSSSNRAVAVEESPSPVANPKLSLDLNAAIALDPSLDLVISTEIASEASQAEQASPQVTVEQVADPNKNKDGIEILVDMATKGEIDPKNIDIIDVTDRFLQAIAAAPKENLRQSGRILFHASLLLRMKAEALLNYPDDSLGDDFLDFDEDGTVIFDSANQLIARQITIHDLERALVRRSHMNHIRTRKVTLDELIEALREAERMENRVERKREPRIDLGGHHEVNDVGDILELAHEEDVDAVIIKVENILVEKLPLKQLMSLLDLIRFLGRKDWVDTFLAILFLANAGKITLEQEEFYGPLYVCRADEQGPDPLKESA